MRACVSLSDAQQQWNYNKNISLRTSDFLSMCTNEPAAVQADFIIEPDKRLELAIKYPMMVGRNFSVVIRALDALQPANNKDVATPADWSAGQLVIIPVPVNDAKAKTKFGKFEKRLLYLRMI